MIGTTLAHYEILGKVGEGGMGAVYRARDTKLDREVALKFLPPEFARDTERVARFQREARTLASLSHPSIASIFGLEEADAHRFLVMELIDGEDLSQRLARGRMPQEEALAVAEQMSQALESAHEAQIVHRDLKPANVKLAAGGRVKLLDFGLARAISSSVTEGDIETSPTITAAFTQVGTILGTAAYMSPEQARGQDVDHRADIWAFGCVLFEMFSGQRLFVGETTSDTLASVIKEQPDWDRLPAETPPVIVAIIQRCLEKDPRRRLQSIGEARIAIERLQQGAEGDNSTLLSANMVRIEEPTATEASRKRTGIWITAVVAAAVVGAILGTQFSSSEPPAPRLRKFVIQPDDLQVAYPAQPALSPDGRRIAYFENTSLSIQDLHSLKTVRVENSEGATAPFWSPDGQWLAFGLSGRVYKVAAAGGTPDVVCDINFSLLDGATWSDENILYLAPDSGPIFAVPDRGGDPVPFFEQGPGESDYHTPTDLPGPGRLLFTTHDADGRETIEVIDDGVRKVLLKIPGARLEYATWSPSPDEGQGHILYHRLNTNEGLWAVPFDLNRLELTGEPFLLDSEGAFPSLARDGALLYSSGNDRGPVQLVIVNRSGEVVSRIGQPQESISTYALSPDGKWILAVATEAGQIVGVWPEDHDIEPWHPMANPNDVRLRERGIAGVDQRRKGHRLLHRVGRGARPDHDPPGLRGGRAAGTREGLRRIGCPRGDVMALVIFGPKNTNDLYTWTMGSEDPPVGLMQTKASEVGPMVSPDGRYLVYMSNESGTNQVFMTSFPSGDGKWQISTDGGVWPKWNGTGDEVIFRRGAGATAEMISVAVQTDGAVQLGTPTVLFSAADAPSLSYSSGFGAYECMPDSDQMVMIERITPGETSNASLVFVEDWYESYLAQRQ